MNPRAPRIAIVIVLSLLAGFTMAQERTASQPFNGATDVTSPALVQKISYLKQVNTVLEKQLDACRKGLPMPTASEITVEDNGDFASKQGATSGQTDNEPVTGTSTQVNMHYAQAVAPRRTGGVIQQSTEPKLTCDDYSMSYFSRHPAMAAVCGKTDELQHLLDPVPPAAVAVPVVSPTTAISASAPIRPRIYSVSGTVPVHHL